MKPFLLMGLFSMSLSALFAQHDQHNMGNKNTGQQRSQQQGARRIGPVVEYHLYVKDTVVNFTGKKRRAFAINGQIPAPTLRFTEGDSAVIWVHNLLKEEVSIHWHGVLLPNEQDGVHVLNTPPIHAGQTHVFRFRIIQNGTLWYHSHTTFQEQEGLYGPLVFYPATPEEESGKMEEILQLSDWRDERGKSIMRSLKRRNEWYAIQKKSVQSWGEAIVKGHFGDKVQMEWTRMPGADVSDVYYQRHLMHGQPVRTFEKYKKGDSVLLRVINGSAATYYWLQYSGGKMRVMASDGTNVKPVEVDKILIATAETYDIMIKIPDDGQYEFRATAQDITRSTSAFFGSGPLVRAKDIPPLDYMVLMREMNQITWMMKGMGMKMKMGLYMKMDMNNMKGMGGMQGMDHGNMNMDNMNHGATDTSGAKMNMDSVNHMDHRNMNMTDSSTQKQDTTSMEGMDHSKMPGMQKQATTKKPVTSTTKKTTKAPAKKTTTTKKPAAKKPAPKKPAPKKKDPMEGMDHSKHGGSSYAPVRNENYNLSMVPNLLTTEKIQGEVSRSTQPTDTVSNKAKQNTMQDHGMPNMASVKKDTVPNKNQSSNQKNMNMQNMQHGNMNMGGMQGGVQKSTMNARDTSRSYMLQTMMPRTPMTGFDFPPGNGDDVVLAYDMLASDSGATTLPSGRPWREIELTLSGNMLRFIWSINGKTLSRQDEKIMIRKGENVRVVFTNATMMEHPIHLHGHFFRVINNQGGYAPMKHTFNINAMSMQVIEFAATEEKDWFLHCHTLYHMISGMATIFSYAGTESEVQKSHPKEFKRFLREHGEYYFPWANIAVHNQGTFGTAAFSGPKAQLFVEWKYDWKRSYEVEPRLQYFLDKRQFFSAFIGTDLQHIDDIIDKVPVHLEKKHVATAGLIYTLPFFINAEGRVDHTGRFRLQFQREDLPLTTRSRLDFFWNTDKEYGFEARYIISKYFAISANYDSELGWGAGLSIVY